MYTNAQRRSNVRRRETGEGREGEMEGEVEEGGGVMKFGKSRSIDMAERGKERLRPKLRERGEASRYYSHL
uniref:Uncharacterized protein n=1 Tax=Pristionchus pacificus TaxID=54126 RepID=A0A2A6BSP6_PRIPA|eukprot:PDM68934.1 hypothetical protein PRIPAC_47236 [Pristionchus pacificus]